MRTKGGRAVAVKNVVFQPLSSGNIKLSERIAANIQEMVRDGKLRAGDRLPAERELAKHFNVSRTTVREAIHVLWERGLAERKNRKGTRILSMQPATVGAAIERYFVLGDCRHAHMHEVRAFLEPKVAALAAKHAKREDRGKLTQLITELEESWASKQVDRLASADVRFHLALASASHNPLIVAIFSGLTPVLERFLPLQAALMPRAKSFPTHRKIYEAVMARDPLRAEKAMVEHMRTSPVFK